MLIRCIFYLIHKYLLCVWWGCWSAF